MEEEEESVSSYCCPDFCSQFSVSLWLVLHVNIMQYCEISCGL